MTRSRALPALLLLATALHSLPALAADAATEVPASVRVAEIVKLRGKGPAAAEELRAALADPREPVRSAAVQTIARELGAAAVPDLVARLDDPEETVCVNAALALTSMPSAMNARPDSCDSV